MKIEKLTGKGKIGIIALVIILLAIFVYAADGDPSQFGNSTDTTVWIGGSSGEGNFTGNVNLNNTNTTGVDCVIFTSGGKICSGT